MPDALWLALTVPGALLWLAVLALPWSPWSTREHLETTDAEGPRGVDRVTVLIPARNEARTIGATLAALRDQGEDLDVIVVDDRSTDGTAAAARRADLARLSVVEGREPPPGWTGKLWALEQGLPLVTTPLTLLLDADIRLGPLFLQALLDRFDRDRLHLLSVMATLDTGCLWEKLLLPPFVHFFKLLYPFRLANTPGRRTAAAAGGCILVDTTLLHKIGAFASVKSELIDDCALAARAKAAGFSTWIGLSRSVVSRRRYRSLAPIWEMVTRTAYTQLHASPWLLAGCVVMLSWAFWLPLAGLAAPLLGARIAAAAALLAMMGAYLPTLRYYGLSPLWALTLPLTGTLYLAMTLDSARRYHHGVRARWKDRVVGPPSVRTGE